MLRLPRALQLTRSPITRHHPRIPIRITPQSTPLTFITCNSFHTATSSYRLSDKPDSPPTPPATNSATPRPAAKQSELSTSSLDKVDTSLYDPRLPNILMYENEEDPKKIAARLLKLEEEAHRQDADYRKKSKYMFALMIGGWVCLSFWRYQHGEAIMENPLDMKGFEEREKEKRRRPAPPPTHILPESWYGPFQPDTPEWLKTLRRYVLTPFFGAHSGLTPMEEYEAMLEEIRQKNKKDLDVETKYREQHGLPPRSPTESVASGGLEQGQAALEASRRECRHQIERMEKEREEWRQQNPGKHLPHMADALAAEVATLGLPTRLDYLRMKEESRVNAEYDAAAAKDPTLPPRKKVIYV